MDNIYSDDARVKAGQQIGMRAFSDSTASRHRAVAKQRHVLETSSTPFLYTVMSVFYSNNYEIAYQAYLTLCILCSLTSILVLCRLLSYSTLAATSVIILLTFCFEPLLSDIRVANVNQIQLSLLVLFIWLQSREKWRYRYLAGGSVIGLMVMFKPNTIFVPALLLLFWLISGLYRRLVWSLSGFIFVAVFSIWLSSIFFGSYTCWIDWLRALKMLPASITTVEMGNFALMRVLIDRFGSAISSLLPILLFAFTACFIWFTQRKMLKKREKMEDRMCWVIETQLAALGCLIYLISAPLAWLHYYLLTIPMILISLHASFSQKFSFGTHSFIYRTLTLTAVAMIIAVRWIILFYGSHQTSIVIFLLCAGTLLLFSLGLNDLRRISKL
jgi:hypothetical protein